MNTHPKAIVGKVVKDCYEDSRGRTIIEFTDGTRMDVKSSYLTVKNNGVRTNELIIQLV